MAQLSRTDLKTKVNNLIIENSNGEITATILNEILRDVADSCFNNVQDAAFDLTAVLESGNHTNGHDIILTDTDTLRSDSTDYRVALAETLDVELAPGLEVPLTFSFLGDLDATDITNSKGFSITRMPSGILAPSAVHLAQIFAEAIQLGTFRSPGSGDRILMVNEGGILFDEDISILGVDLSSVLSNGNFTSDNFISIQDNFGFVMENSRTIETIYSNDNGYQTTYINQDVPASRLTLGDQFLKISTQGIGDETIENVTRTKISLDSNIDPGVYITMNDNSTYTGVDLNYARLKLYHSNIDDTIKSLIDIGQNSVVISHNNDDESFDSNIMIDNYGNVTTNSTGFSSIVEVPGLNDIGDMMLTYTSFELNLRDDAWNSYSKFSQQQDGFYYYINDDWCFQVQEELVEARYDLLVGRDLIMPTDSRITNQDCDIVIDFQVSDFLPNGQLQIGSYNTNTYSGQGLTISEYGYWSNMETVIEADTYFYGNSLIGLDNISGIKINPTGLNQLFGQWSATSLPSYSDNSAAVSGGLSVNRLYKTPTGEIRIVI